MAQTELLEHSDILEEAIKKLTDNHDAKQIAKLLFEAFVNQQSFELWILRQQFAREIDVISQTLNDNIPTPDKVFLLSFTSGSEYSDYWGWGPIVCRSKEAAEKELQTIATEYWDEYWDDNDMHDEDKVKPTSPTKLIEWYMDVNEGDYTIEETDILDWADAAVKHQHRRRT